MKYNMESDSLNKIVDCVFENLKNNKIDLVEAIAHIAVIELVIMTLLKS